MGRSKSAERGDAPVRERIAAIYRAESQRVFATLIRLLGDFDLAEEALHDAFQTALERWARDGIPRNPRAWLVSTGRFKGIDALRRRARGAELALAATPDAIVAPVDPAAWDAVEDDQLRLIFTCCHPTLPVEGRIALALREVCGLRTAEIARAFLVSTEAMKKRLARAKATIREQRILYEIPSRNELAKRLATVLRVVYLVYNEGYAASSGDRHIKTALTTEAVFLSRLIVDLIPQPEALGLLALLLLHESRSRTRTDDAGDPVPLEQQDRSRWDRALIAEGTALLQRAMMSGRIGAYTLQAAIVSVHAAAASVAVTNWALIVGYYDMLLRLEASPVVELQRAIAVAMRDGPQAGLLIVDRLAASRSLRDYHQLYAVQADLARRLGAIDRATESYQRAIELAQPGPERRYLQRQLKQLAG